MMPTPESSPCPVCSTVGTLNISDRIRVKPLGSFSLAGAQMKAPGRVYPFLECTACGLAVEGRYDQDGRHATFTPPGVESATPPG
jgi:hypothetical protein